MSNQTVLSAGRCPCVAEARRLNREWVRCLRFGLYQYESLARRRDGLMRIARTRRDILRGYSSGTGADDDNQCGRCGHTPSRCTCLKPADNE